MTIASVVMILFLDNVFTILQGGVPGAANLGNCKILESIVKKQAENGKLYAAICAAPAIALGSWGLLKGLKVSSFISFPA